MKRMKVVTYPKILVEVTLFQDDVNGENCVAGKRNTNWSVYVDCINHNIVSWARKAGDHSSRLVFPGHAKALASRLYSLEYPNEIDRMLPTWHQELKRSVRM